jgi:hypothetical protein
MPKPFETSQDDEFLPKTGSNLVDERYSNAQPCICAADTSLGSAAQPYDTACPTVHPHYQDAYERSIRASRNQ